MTGWGLDISYLPLNLATGLLTDDDLLGHEAVGCWKFKMSSYSKVSVKHQHSLMWNLSDEPSPLPPPGNLTGGGGTIPTRHTWERGRIYHTLLLWTLALWLAGGVLEGSKSLSAAPLRGNEILCGALVPVKNIFKRDKGQIKALGSGAGGIPYASDSMFCANLSKYSIWLWATQINRSCLNCRHLQSILCKTLGNRHRNRSSRARDLLQGEN